MSAAQLHLSQTERQARAAVRSWPQALGRHRAPLLIAGGLLSGVAIAGLPERLWSRIGATLFGIGATLARSPIAPALLSAALARVVGRSRQRLPAATVESTRALP